MFEVTKQINNNKEITLITIGFIKKISLCENNKYQVHKYMCIVHYCGGHELLNPFPYKDTF